MGIKKNPPRGFNLQTVDVKKKKSDNLKKKKKKKLRVAVGKQQQLQQYNGIRIKFKKNKA